MSLFTPNRWKTGDVTRDHRCAEMLSESLARGLSRWFQVKVIPWGSRTSTRPRLFFTLQEDIDDAKQTCGDTFDHTKHVVLCLDVTTSSPSTTPSETSIVGPVTTSKLQDALMHLFPKNVFPFGLHTFSDQASATKGDEERSIRVEEESTEESDDDARGGLLAVSLSNLEVESKQQEHGEDDSTHVELTPPISPSTPLDTGTSEARIESQVSNLGNLAQERDPSETELPAPSDTITAEPNLLLVDDNTVNLKVLNMYARKCSSMPPTSASGGQEAIDAFNNAVASHEGGRPFDLIFLDLSMPHISGFDVARQIRETEARLKCGRTYICALTGLVSKKDRNNAYASGVDNYLVRPAKLGDLQSVIEIWRSSLVRQ
jgi:CheY-like chemotaxis protein